MSRESKRRAKAQRRETRKRAEKTRRQLADHCAQWMYDAEDAWFAKDFLRARQCFRRILHVRPTHQAANERMAELLFIDGLHAEGLQHFDRLVFTRFRATLDELEAALTAAGHRVSVFHGGLSPADKHRAIDAFEDDAAILLWTEVGGEGRNLQFCRTVINGYSSTSARRKC